jgi:asparagine synthase (glutamine-hydrolysing)
MSAPDSVIHPASIEEMCKIAAATPPGCFIEVGVYKGGSAWHLARVAREQLRALHLFDTFKGIPCKDPIDAHGIGDFGDTDWQTVQDAMPDAILHIGTFPYTFPNSLTEISFVHVDCDQYQSVRDCICMLWPRIVTGGVMFFDDWECLAGATQAIKQMTAAYPFNLTSSNKLYVRKS